MTIFLVQGGPLKSFMSDSHFFDLPPHNAHNRFLMVWVVTLDWSLSFYGRRQCHPTPVLLPGKSQGRRSLVGCSSWGCEESDMTERLHFHFSLMHWRRKWQPTPVFLPGESQGQRTLVGCRLGGRTESDTTDATWQQQQCPSKMCILKSQLLILLYSEIGSLWTN